MVLYTPLLENEIFPSEDESKHLITYQGKLLYVRQNEIGEIQLMQLLSTDPQDFLQADFTPGTIIKNDFFQQTK